MLAEAVELLEAQPPGPELVRAHTYMAGRTHMARNPEAVAAADRALALAAELGLPEPAFALHRRGVARCDLGEADGLEDMRRALQLALEQGLGRETAVIYGNLAGRLVLRGAAGRTRHRSGRDRLLRAARHHRGRAAAARQPDLPGRARTDGAGARRGRAARRPPRGRR